jgi:hypothetical protein
MIPISFNLPLSFFWGYPKKMVGGKGMRKLTWWGKFLVLLGLSLILAGPAGAQSAGAKPPSAKPPSAKPADAKPAGAKSPVAKAPKAKYSPPFTDYGYFLGDLHAAGALKFYDNTEAILRLAQFERALMRYRFLKGHIQGKRDYYGLLSMVNLRLKFLKKQLHLRDVEVAAIPARRERIPKPKPPVVKPGAAKPKPPGKMDKKAAKTQIIPGLAVTPTPAAQVPAAQVPVAAPLPTAQKPPPIVTSDTKAKEDEKAQEEKDKEETKPVVPLSYWQKLKLRLHLGKKPANSG